MIDYVRYRGRMSMATARASVLVLVVALGGVTRLAAAAEAGAALADAAEKADWQRVRTILKESPNANASQVDGMTALHWAAYHDDVDAAKALLAAGASAKAENRYGVTPL